jgi:hypothetical protein
LSHLLVGSKCSWLWAERSKILAFFIESRNGDNVMVKRDGGLATVDAAKVAGCEDAKKMKADPKTVRLDIGRILVRQNANKPTRY